MATITLRAVKGSPLTNAEVDANFTNLNNELATKVNTSSLAAVATTGAYADLSGKPTIPTLTSQLTNDSGYLTSLSSLTGGIASPDYVQFSTTGATAAVARITWNDTDGTLEFGLKGGNVVLQIGQEQVLRATNSTGSTIANGTAVYITGSTGSHVNVVKAQANAESTSSKTLGLTTESISNGQSGFVCTSGLVRGIDTSALTEGEAVWLSAGAAGGLTSIRPTPPNHAVLIGWCVRSHASVGVIYVHVMNGYELSEIHDVLLTSKANNDVLSYDSASGLWKNRALATVANTGAYSDLTGKPTNVSTFTNDSGYLTTNQTITFTGDATGSGTTAVSLSLANSGVTAGTYTNASITVDAKGRVTSASSGSGGGVTSFNTRTGAITLTSSDVTTALGYTPSDNSNQDWGLITGSADSFDDFGGLV